MGQGRIVDKGCAEHLGLSWLGCKSPAGHRKIGYLAGVPDRYIQKFKNFYHSLLLRMRHALDGRGSHSFQELKDVGADMANVRNLAFCCGLVPVLSNVVRPMAMQTQDISDLPWTRWRAFEGCVREFKAVREDIGRFRRYLRVLVLISPYLSDDARAVRSWWMGYCSSVLCRRLRSGGSHLAAVAHGILWTGSFQGCDLLIAPGVLVKRNFEFAHHACLCGTSPQLVPGTKASLPCADGLQGPSLLHGG